MFIDRKVELEQLERLYASHRAELYVLYAPSIPPSFKKYTELVEDVVIEQGTLEQMDGFVTVKYKSGAFGKDSHALSRSIYISPIMSHVVMRGNPNNFLTTCANGLPG